MIAELKLDLPGQCRRIDAQAHRRRLLEDVVGQAEREDDEPNARIRFEHLFVNGGTILRVRAIVTGVVDMLVAPGALQRSLELLHPRVFEVDSPPLGERIAQRDRFPGRCVSGRLTSLNPRELIRISVSISPVSRWRAT